MPATTSDPPCTGPAALVLVRVPPGVEDLRTQAPAVGYRKPISPRPRPDLPGRGRRRWRAGALVVRHAHASDRGQLCFGPRVGGGEVAVGPLLCQLAVAGEEDG